MKAVRRNRAKYKARIEALISEMTLTEKVSQLLHNAPAIERLNIPAYNWWNEGLHGVARAGVATVFPQAIALAASFDEESLYQVADVVATEGRARYNTFSRLGDRDIYKGLTFWSPNVNIFRDPRWGRGHETYGEDPYLSSRLGVSFINGLQGDDPTYLKAAACAKHFAVHSGPEEGRHAFDALVSEKDMRETYFPAFRAAVEEAHVESVMSAYNRVNGEAASASPYLLQKVLREEWGFEGHVVSDCWAIRDIFTFHNLTDNPVDAVAMSIEAGCDLNCGTCYSHAVDAVIENKLDEAKIDQALTRLLTTRMLLGLIDDDSCPYDSISYLTNDCLEHEQFNLETARKVPVLLKNDGVLPLAQAQIKTLGIIGPNAQNQNALEGNYQGTASRYWTILDGVKDYLREEDTRILFSEGCHLYKEKMSNQAQAYDRVAEVKAICEESDVIIAVFGLDPGLEGEQGDKGNQFASGDKPDLLLPGIQREVLEIIYSYNKPVVLLVLSGSCLALDADHKHANAIMQCWYPGAQGGKAVAELLFGAYSPEGKLPVTFYSEAYEIPDFEDYSMTNRTYRFVEDGVLYPFGFGLTYGDVQIGNLETTWESETLKVHVNVKNASNIPINETLQIYIQAPEYGPLHPQLKAFKKVNLNAREEKNCVLELNAESFQVVNDEGQFVTPEGSYELYVGFHQPDPRSEELSGQACKRLTVKR